jgi:hypothetical protein
MRCRVIPTKLARPCSVVLVEETGSAAGTAAKAAVHHPQIPLHLAFPATCSAGPASSC